MGSSCSHAADVLANLATEDEIRDAVKSFNEWNRVQERTLNTGGAGPRSTLQTGPLFQRVGGLGVVKQIVEGFYRRLYSDPTLLVYLHDKEMVYLRARQTAFMAWLFGPPNVPYGGKNLRVAHLKLIKQRGFCPEDFELGMEYFTAAMRELEVPELTIREVMSKVRPFKDAIFTPSPKDEEEELRWGVEERFKQFQQGRQLLPTSSSKPNSLGSSSCVSGSIPQCPFTSGRLSLHVASGNAADPAAYGFKIMGDAFMPADVLAVPAKAGVTVTTTTTPPPPAEPEGSPPTHLPGSGPASGRSTSGFRPASIEVLPKCAEIESYTIACDPSAFVRSISPPPGSSSTFSANSNTPTGAAGAPGERSSQREQSSSTRMRVRLDAAAGDGETQPACPWRGAASAVAEAATAMSLVAGKINCSSRQIKAVSTDGEVRTADTDGPTSAAAAANGQGELLSLAALEAELGLPKGGSLSLNGDRAPGGGGAAARGDGKAAAGDGTAGGTALVDAFLWEMIEQEAKEKAQAKADALDG
ncbi:hypothetical protein VOLCADRAFT_90168 [Volvox carteri f. nagariensis]|uniref:Globin n=1 Tax=Volvox carteri f. nagariensis TaxID=3068 RepID=D8TTN4_VOLCA|nr:uncharacterized protein VOLCADRAFT_90168 [Volvox carteri f. nagariensis]EFJ49341.1 hypothetical protein VOLCADRAFT_90168 [Volvox carteri f. nagariensis]|eukprot:XP_002949789.1 hypothetical protein VOLCADRAFT_90168 [Volvox carteri f. nagariensis]